MTIVFHGHVKSLETSPIGKLAVTLVTPAVEAGGQEWVVFVPEADGADWIPGRMVCFTIYSLANSAKQMEKSP